MAIIAVLYPCLLKSQDTVALKEVDVTTQRSVLSSVGKKTETIDSVTKQQFVFNSVGDILSLNTPVFIKNYGPGSLSTSAFRGGNASQTAIMWNGFNIQNGMLGQIDLALLPSVLFDKITIEYGGSSSLWGSGAVGGSIRLDSKPHFNRGFTTIANLGMGSFGLFNASTNFEYSTKKFISSTKAYLQNSLNDYRYKDTLDKEHPLKTQKHAIYSFKGVMQEFRFLLNQKQTLSVNAWYNAGARQLPVYSSSNLSRAEQTDGNFKGSLSWNYITAKYNSGIRAAFFYDKLNYTDSIYDIFSKSKLQTVIAENENNLKWRQNNTFNFGINLTSYSGEVENYSGTKTMNKGAVFIGNKFSFFEGRLISFVSVRGEYFSTGKSAITGNASLEYKIFKSITAKASAAKVYRQPTLNELYWTPGGNPNLLPEEGYTYEGDLSYRKMLGEFSVFISGSAYMRTINNWILWLPGPNITTPVNIQQVFSRGTETSSKLVWQRNKLKLGLNVTTGYVLSTVQSSKQENGNTESRQLIYTPRYTVNGNFLIAYKALTLIYYHQYIGYRFTTSDNLQWLTPYHYSTVRMNFNTSIQQTTNLLLFASCNNLFNVDYAVIAGHNMPLRSFEIGITLSTNKPNKIKPAETTP
ncbi:MAG: TonB-dependent receptor plug domain-containing protein [Bacteroidia bacterium]